VYQPVSERNSPTPVFYVDGLVTQKGLGRVIPSDEGPREGLSVWSREIFFCHSVSIYDPLTKKDRDLKCKS